MEDGFSSQIDHVIISIYGIFVIETKNNKGWIYGSENKMYWTQNIWGKKYQLYNPIWQNISHINVLKSRLYAPSSIYKSIVVFVNASSLKIWGNIGNVLLRKDIYNYIIGHTHQVLDYSECVSLADALIKSNKTDSLTKKKHINNVKTRAELANMRLADGLCPLCGAKLVRRAGAYGAFWGCSRYPNCRFTKQ